MTQLKKKHPGGGGSKRCNTFWDTGKCPFDFKCAFSHVENPNRKKATVTNVSLRNEGWTATRAAPASQNKLDTTFPTYSCVKERCTDDILFSSKNLSPGNAKKLIQSHTTEGSKVNSPNVAEDILFALNASNRNNELWDFGGRQSLLSTIGTMPSELLIRLGQIVRWPSISRTGDKKGEMSFLSCYMGFVAYLTCEAVIKSASEAHVNALYAIIDIEMVRILKVFKLNIQECLDAASFKDRSVTSYGRTKVVSIVSGVQIFKPIAVLLLEYIDRYRSATTSHPELNTFVESFSTLFEMWEDQLLRNEFEGDALATRSMDDKKYFFKAIRKDIELLKKVVARSLPIHEDDENGHAQLFVPSFGVIADVDRHDNDHVDVGDIKLAPTTQELLSLRAPYLPANLPGARHHLQADSIEKILDIQFRLLRNDATASLKAGVALILQDLLAVDFTKTQRGGRFVGSPDGGDMIMMPIITSIEFRGMELTKQGLVIRVWGDAPPGSNKRSFWEQGKRLPLGGLVALVTKEARMPPTVCLALLTTFPTDIKKIERSGRSAIEFGLSFVEAADGLRAVEALRHRDSSRGDIRVLLESPVLWASVQPFMKSLHVLDPLQLPLAEYIKHGELTSKTIALPRYATEPNFKWDLSVLLRPDVPIRQCELFPSSTASIAAAREVLHEHGKLDPSQNDAVIDSLTREIALIQGPPGTGKTFTGVELLRLLFANNIGPVMLLAFTNHALDHILRAVHDNEVTRDMLRLGSRSKDEVVSQYTLEVLEKVQPRGSLHKESGAHVGRMKDLEKKMSAVSEHITSRTATDDQALKYLEEEWPLLKASLENPPEFVHALYVHESDSNGWLKAGRKVDSSSLWSFWYEGKDLRHLRTLQREPVNKLETSIAAISNPMLVYKQLARTVNTGHLPHVIAYEAAVSAAFREEVAIISQSPMVSQRDPTEIALRLARRRVGAPFPRGEARFKIEALIETINVRFQLYSIAKAAAKALQVDIPQLATTAWHEQIDAEKRKQAGRRFDIVAHSLLRSVRRDAELASNLARDSESWKLYLSAAVVTMRAHWAFTRFCSEARIRDAARNDPNARHIAATLSINERLAAQSKWLASIAVVNQYGNTTGAIWAWMETTIRPAVDILLYKWNAYNIALPTGVFYSSVSEKEKLAIAKAVVNASYGSAGRFYQCPNGHSFTIGECGQAMEEAYCPECGANIGGRSRTLRSDNRRDMDMERLAMQAGAVVNPFARM